MTLVLPAVSAVAHTYVRLKVYLEPVAQMSCHMGRTTRRKPTLLNIEQFNLCQYEGINPSFIVTLFIKSTLHSVPNTD